MLNAGKLENCNEESYHLLLLPSPGAVYPASGKSRENSSRSLPINVKESKEKR